ncbi:MAG: hypothetical protein PHO32_03170 [Candidatus Cloacimonetes bacterium]|nr:hypothetical protein [Candidatus Cloacimonadota bacterium]
MLLFLCFGFYVVTGLEGIELPIAFHWDSSNLASIAPSQEGKEVSWNEFYRIGIELDSLRWREFSLYCLLQSNPDYISNNLAIDNFQVSYRKTAWQFIAVTKPIGFGKRDKLNPYYIIDPTIHKYRFSESRFNGLGLNYHTTSSQIGASLGGNMQNQATGILNFLWENPDESITIAASQTAHVMDSHWRSPVMISSGAIEWNTDPLSLNSETAFSHFIGFDRTKAHNSIYNYTELGWKPSTASLIHLSAEYRTLEPASYLQQQYQLSFNNNIGCISITPGCLMDIYRNEEFYQANLLVNWFLLSAYPKDYQTSRVGLLYRAEGKTLKSIKHSIGLQAELHYGI